MASEKFTGNKDVDQLILKTVRDRDLFNTCISNKYLNSLCNDDFFYNRMKERYPGVINHKPKDLSWRKYYLEFAIYKDKMGKEFNFNFKSGNPKFYYDILSVAQLLKETNKIDKIWTLLMQTKERDLREYFEDLLH